MRIAYDIGTRLAEIAGLTVDNVLAGQDETANEDAASPYEAILRSTLRQANQVSTSSGDRAHIDGQICAIHPLDSENTAYSSVNISEWGASTRVNERWIGPEGLMSATCVVAGDATGGAFAVVRHVLAPGILAAPPHRHRREDEYSYVLEGRVWLLIGDAVQSAGPGEVVAKPRGLAHTFWNEGATEACLLEMITPPGLEGYFAELADIIPSTPGETPDLERLGRAAANFALELDLDGVSALMTAHGVRLPGM